MKRIIEVKERLASRVQRSMQEGKIGYMPSVAAGRADPGPVHDLLLRGCD
jgi:hypothetical protein